MEDTFSELNSMKEELEYMLSDLESGCLDPGEEYELRRQTRILSRQIREMEEAADA